MNSRPSHVEWRVLMWLGVAAAIAGCSPDFKPRNFANPEALFRASVLEFQLKHWNNARIGFESLANDLSARDPLLASTYYYLGLTHEQRKEFLLAAQAYERVTDGFPDDTLAPRAMLGVGRSYQRQWRKPALDPQDGEKAISILRALLSSYPDAKETTEAKARIAELEEWFARKDYETGMHYIRVRKATDPAIIYFKDVVTTYPNTKVARLAWLRLHELYTKIRWKEDAAETCQAMWTAYPADVEVRAKCGAPKAAAATDTAKLPVGEIVPPQGYARPAPR
ncbi:MAG: outer membrane protein assembly factor BamD [Gemmatimonadota bacterium]